MKVACFISVKSNSERVPSKNFRILCGKPLYQYIIDHSIEANCVDVYPPEKVDYYELKDFID